MKEDKLQSIINNDLFSSTPMVDGLKQVLQFMEPHAQPLSQEQLRAIAYLNYLGMRPLHEEYRKANKGKHPYSDHVKWIMESAIAHADPGVFIRTIEAVIPPQQTQVIQQSERRQRK